MDKKEKQQSYEQTKYNSHDVQPLPLPKGHKCYGCVWYPRDTDILFCPFQRCIRYKEGFSFRRENQ